MEKMESYLYSLTDIQWSQRDDKRNIRNWEFHEIFIFKAYEEVDITDLRWVLSYSRTSIIRTSIIRTFRLSGLFLWSRFFHEY